MLEILFEDEYILACIKPCGILSQADSSGKESMVSLLERYTNGTVFPLHRLDREVSGVMVYAKTKLAAARLSTDIAEHRFKKEYIAVVHGYPLEVKGEMRDLLFKDSRRNKTYVVDRKRAGVKEALLEYEVIKASETDEGRLTAVKVLLHTGRTHQIRVQFASRKMPLCGDKKYGGRDDFKTIGLLSYRITFNHPKTNKELCFTASKKAFTEKYIN